jgi:hypothetical protein
MMRPGPWRRPVRTRSGGLSTIEVKPGSSAACFGCRGVLENGRRGARRLLVVMLGWGHFGIARPIGLCWVCSDRRRQVDILPVAMVLKTRGLEL